MIKKKGFTFTVAGAPLVVILTLLSSTASAEGPSIAEGARIYNDNCSRCHNPRPAEDYTAREWSVIMPHMRDRAHLTRQETEAVELFLAATLTPPGGAPVETQESLSAREATSGEDLFSNYGCLGCHKMEEDGGNLGPRLDVTLDKKGTEFMVEKILNPALGNPSSTMPKFPLTEVEARAIVEYIRSVVKS